MAVPSQMLPLGTSLPDFSLPDVVSGGILSSAALRGRPAIVAFICNHCPFVKHIREKLAEFGQHCEKSGVALVAINSNDIATYPQDGPQPMAEEAKRVGYSFPYLFDESQDVAKLFQAACTPDFYLFDRSGSLVYRGQFDDSRPGNGKPVTGRDLYAAVDAVVRGDAPVGEQRPSIGCSLKWKAGNEPDYAR